MPPETFDPDSLLPLPTAVFHILVALADRDRHGYSIMQDVFQQGLAAYYGSVLTPGARKEFLNQRLRLLPAATGRVADC